jgi:hypothetical protein
MKRVLLITVLALLTTAAPGCGKQEQTFTEGMQLLCGSTASLPSTMSPAEKARAIAESADKKVTNKEVRELAGSLAALDGPQKVDRLRAAATRAGIERCGLVELWTESPMQKALRTICEAPNRVGLSPDAPPSERAQAIANYIQANVTDPDALELMRELAAESPESRTTHLADDARRNGLASCPLADLH